MDWKELNSLKQEGWKANTEAELNEWKLKVRGWWDRQSFMGDQKANAKGQITDLIGKKEAWLKKGKASIVRNAYIFREDEGQAFIRLCDAMAAYLKGKEVSNA